MRWAIKNSERIEAEPRIKYAKCPCCDEEVIPKCGRIKIWHWAHKHDSDCDPWYEPESEWHLNWKDEFTKECQEVVVEKCVSDYCYSNKEGTAPQHGAGHYPCDHKNCCDCDFKIHRADIKINGQVIELQNSPLSQDKIIEREEFYDEMVWLLNGNALCKGLQLRQKVEYFSFRWKHPPKSWWSADKPIYVDFGEMVKCMELKIKKYKDGREIHKSPMYEEVWNDYMDYYQSKIYGYYEDTKEEIIRLEDKRRLLQGKIFLIRKINKSIPCGGWGILITKEDFLERYGRGGREIKQAV